MRSLILGAGGLIGAALTATAVGRGLAVECTWYRRPLGHGHPVDVLDQESVASLVADVEPDVIWLAAGMSQIDYAEAHPAECWQLAVEGTTHVAEAARKAKARVVLFTSDQVLGECRHPASEDQVPAPLSVYGRAQWESERLVRAILPEHSLIIRTAVVYGVHERPGNLAFQIISRLARGCSVPAARDRMLQPTYAPDLAAAAFDAVARGALGVLHLVGAERLSEYAFAKQIAFVHGFDCDLVEGLPAFALMEDAPRPLHPWLDRGRMRALLGARVIRPISEGLRAVRDANRITPLVRAA